MNEGARLPTFVPVGKGVAVGVGVAVGMGVAVGSGVAVGARVAVGGGVVVGTGVAVGSGSTVGVGKEVAVGSTVVKLDSCSLMVERAGRSPADVPMYFHLITPSASMMNIEGAARPSSRRS